MKKINQPFFSLTLCMVFFITAGIISCKKSKGDDGGTNPPVSNELSDADSLKYLMYRIMQVSFVDGGRDSSLTLPTYYWYDKVPSLDPLSSEFDSAEVLLNKIKTYPINPSNGKVYDKYSFLDKEGTVAGEIQGGVAGDLGMEVTYVGDGTPANTELYVIYTDKNSPAGQKGVQRGWQITAINDNSVSYDGGNGPNVQRVINAVYYDASASFTFLKPDNSSQKITLAKTVYNLNPVLFDTVYNISGKSTGYFVFNTFSSIETDQGAATLTRQELDRVFSKFRSAGINNLIVDLRYNGGGAVPTAEYIDNNIAPASASGQEMYHYVYNNVLNQYIGQIGGLEDKVSFGTTGSLSLDNIFFIVSGSTASASELTINNLKPYMNGKIKLVGKTTYGKPVGFFTMGISDFHNGQEKHLADLYAINFETKNKNNEGGYFTGMTPDQDAVDYIDVPWGNSTYDDNLVKIFHYISTGSFARVASPERMANGKALRTAVPSAAMPALRFNGMVNYKMSKQLESLIKQKAGKP